MSGLIPWLLGSDAIPQPAEIQPHLVRSPSVWAMEGDKAVGIYDPDQTAAAFLAPIIGYNVPDIVRTYGTLPSGVVAGGAPNVLDVNAVGGC
ncbi:hypothetical protein [Alicyclobacillus shizuokensis]|uniref:hypothetical protein n=1 Tax=Alicyclobacillus shizuokensis TaxID=392014 RepID=UPI00082A314B|nr:hypothetical protein [Alicyclobacillus shizuokensis]